MEYYFTFLYITWWGGEHMRVDHQYYIDEASCVIEKVERELQLEGQAELSEGAFAYIVGDCELIVNPKADPSET